MYKWGTDNINKYMSFIRNLESNGNKILLVFDGKPGKYKEKEIETRKLVAANAGRYADSLEVELSLQTDLSTDQQAIINDIIVVERKKASRPTKEGRQSLKRHFYEEKINMLKSSQEADDLLVALIKERDIDVIISGDTDLIRLEAAKILVPSEDDTFLELNYSNILTQLNISGEQFHEMCILTGGVASIEVKRNIDIRKAWTWIRIYGSIENLVMRHNDWWPCNWTILKRKIYELKMEIQSICVLDWILEEEKDRLDAWRSGKDVPYTY